MTPLELYDDKFGEENLEEETSFVMERGNIYEPIARKLFSAEYNIENLTNEAFEARLAVSADLPILLASLDGISSDNKVIAEFKFQGKDKHLAISNGEIQPHYLIQVQHQLLVSGAEYCWLVSYNPKVEPNLTKTKILPDEVFFKEHIDKCAKFWMNGQAGIQPEATDQDFVALTKKGAKAKAKRLMFLKEKISSYEEEFDLLKADILSMVSHPKMRCAGLRIVQQTRIGNIAYKDIPEVKALPKEVLEKYRGKSTSFYKLDIEAD